jgi:nicotinamidase-related amidase
MAQIPDNRLTLVFPRLPYFTISRDKTALLIVDMQYLDAHPEHGIGAKAREAGIAEIFDYYWGAVESAISNQRRLLEAAHQAGLNVIYTRIATQTGDARDVGRQHCYVGMAVPKNAKEAEILAEIAPTEEDIVLSKTSSSPFNSTAINQLLRNLGVDTLLVCGVVTNGCVEGTVRDASDLGYNVIMIPDACAAVTPELHQVAITNLNNGFCNCRDTAIVVEEINHA